MSKTYYLRIEGVNLSNFVYDTQDLNTIRGGGLLLLNSIEEIKQKFKEKLEPISTGASSGLFGLDVDNIEGAKSIKKKIEDYINQDENLKHATFVVDILESEKGDKEFKKDREKLIALNRWNQMQSPSVAVPSQISNMPCKIDMVRPATFNLPKDTGKLLVSESVYKRSEYGKEKKRKFYSDITNINIGYEFVNDFDKLAEDNSKDNLNNKMVVIYIDGNDFGKIQSNIEKKEDLKKWDEIIKNYRKKFLSALLSEANNNSDWKNGDKIRLETLLWGGDEIMFVVPAWLGWWTLGFFYQQSKCWSFNNKILKHAGGIVFCHSKAPIHRITDLARKLAELAKKDRSKNLFVYQKLESFDHIGTKSISSYINDAYGGRIKDTDFILNGENMDQIGKEIMKLKENEFSKSLLSQIVRCIITKENDLYKRRLEELEKKVDKKYKILNKTLGDLSNLLNGENAKWIHIAELWDYIV